MAFTKDALVSDIILRVTKGNPSDDLELEPKQVAFWIDMVLAAVVKDFLDKKLINGLGIDPDYIKTEECIDARLKRTDCSDCQNNVYFSLCDEPMNLLRDRGVIRVVTSEGSWVDKTTLFEIDDLNKLKHSKPSLKNLKYHREKDTIYIHGMNINTYLLTQFHVSYVPKIKLMEELSNEDPIYVGEDVLPLIAEQVEQIARRQLYQSAEDIRNNGSQDLNINTQ